MEDIQDAQIVHDPPQEATSGDATVLSSIESLINQHISSIAANKSELKKLREMIASALANDPTYKLHEEEAKKAAKVKAATKSELMKAPANKILVEKANELTTEIKEADAALSEYLREFARLTGTTEFETDDGEVREIVFVAKLVKRSSRG
ncbi:hypothetical protein HY949_03200 [Candidatus Gottesmanbacteria bacterium]|nr:hypothetical protein [Candidatus Gottesmanbacteria bacterium]